MHFFSRAVQSLAILQLVFFVTTFTITYLDEMEIQVHHFLGMCCRRPGNPRVSIFVPIVTIVTSVVVKKKSNEYIGIMLWK